jgi:undecaprenyl-diphosphatase
VTVLQSIALGLIQGATEFLPVSSTAHLILFPWLAGWPDPGQSFDVSLHAGTLVALIIYFWRDWAKILSFAFKRPQDLYYPSERRVLWLIVVGCIPAAVLGYLLESKLEEFALPTIYTNAPLYVAGFLFAGAVLLLWADRIGPKLRKLEDQTFLDAFVVGLFQGLSLLPGFSRSGSSIAGGLVVGLTREAAARFSFLMSAPLIAGAVGKKIITMSEAGLPPGGISALVIGGAAAAVSGYICIAFLLNYLRRHRVDLFVWYRIVLAGGIVAAFFLKP